MKEKLGQDPAFATFHGDMHSTQVGMSKRFYAACAAMQLSTEQLDTSLLDEDMEEDMNGYYIKSETYGNYYVPSHSLIDYKRYSVKKESTPEQRLVRAFYKIADELLKQENI